MEAIYFWIAFGVIAAISASNKNRSAWGWFALGALFGPFGFIASLLVKPLPDHSNVRTTAKPGSAIGVRGRRQLTALEQRLADKYGIAVLSDKTGKLFNVDRKYFRSLDEAVEYIKQSEDGASHGVSGDRSVDVSSVDTNDTKECPFCAELIKSKAKLCKHCKSQLT